MRKYFGIIIISGDVLIKYRKGLIMRVPYIKAIDKDTGKEVQGFYFEYPETSYCFTEDYEKNPVKMISCVVFYTMTDWGLPNKPMLCQNIDKDSIKLIKYIDI